MFNLDIQPLDELHLIRWVYLSLILIFPVTHFSPNRRKGLLTYLLINFFRYLFSYRDNLYVPCSLACHPFISKRIYFAFSQTAPAQTEGKGELVIYYFCDTGNVFAPNPLGFSILMSKSISLAVEVAASAKPILPSRRATKTSPWWSDEMNSPQQGFCSSSISTLSFQEGTDLAMAGKNSAYPYVEVF